MVSRKALLDWSATSNVWKGSAPCTEWYPHVTLLLEKPTNNIIAVLFSIFLVPSKIKHLFTCIFFLCLLPVYTVGPIFYYAFVLIAYWFLRNLDIFVYQFFGYIFPALLRYNWHTASCKFKLHMLIGYTCTPVCCQVMATRALADISTTYLLAPNRRPSVSVRAFHRTRRHFSQAGLAGDLPQLLLVWVSPPSPLFWRMGLPAVFSILILEFTSWVCWKLGVCFFVFPKGEILFVQ